MYAYDSRWNKDCVDASYCNKCELCYDCLDCEGCYGCRECQDCENCDGCEECYDCKGCKDCFGCVGLRRKRFCVYDEEFSEADYKVRLRKIRESSGAGADGEGAVADEVAKLRADYPHVALTSINAENCFGNYIVGSKNSYYVFKVHGLEDCFYMYDSHENKDCADCCAFNKSELCYECMENSTLYNCNFMYWCANCVDCEYLMYCFDCENCFGCFGLKYKKYCVLNEQCASRLEYEQRVGKIVEQMKKEGSYMEGLGKVCCS